jgi:hypothetical protein
LEDEDKRKLVVDVLEGKVKTFKYLNDKPSWAEVSEKMKRFGIRKNEAISELLKNWYEGTEGVKS